MSWKEGLFAADFDAQAVGRVSLDWGQESEEDQRSKNTFDTMSQMKAALFSKALCVV